MKSAASIFRPRGFTLIEAALVTIIVGTGVAASMRLFAACTVQTQAANQLTVGLHLAGNIEEMMAPLCFNDPVHGSTNFGPETGESLAVYNDLDDLDGARFNPPIDAQRNVLPELSQYTQVVSVTPVYPNKPRSNSSETEIPRSTYTGAVRVRVRVLYQPTPTSPARQAAAVSFIRVDG